MSPFVALFVSDFVDERRSNIRTMMQCQSALAAFERLASGDLMKQDKVVSLAGDVLSTNGDE
ncbi:hypothetical protein DID97_24690 [Burkholderia sp. Bp8977]|nr:hypothetical protein DIE10_27460 [Burkholderia sp. Bp9011]RQR87319.1 hypothetical protein DIE09_28425 [Burkholderia sp. Bp9010]RQS69728.1 hypothetical protein DID97_24690 [Burkholderia sp. Bp8977]